MKYTYFILFISFILLSSFQTENDKLLIGHWKRSNYDSSCDCYNYIKVPNLKDRQLGYHFQKEGRIIANLCTDMCGCMARPFEGVWSLKGSKLSMSIKNRGKFNLTLKVINRHQIQLRFD